MNIKLYMYTHHPTNSPSLNETLLKFWPTPKPSFKFPLHLIVHFSGNSWNEATECIVNKLLVLSYKVDGNTPYKLIYT